MANVIKHKRGSGSDPSASNLVIGELAIRTDNGKLFTKMDSGAIAEIAGGGSDIAINTLSSSSATGGGSATFNGSAYRFTLSSPPSVSAQQLLVSINGVIQKPVAGTGQPSEGYSVDGTDIILGDAPATGSDFFILTFRSLGVSEPADNSVTSAKIVDGTIVGTDLATNIDLVDNQKIRFGNSNDLEIYHDGNFSYIRDNGTGDLVIQGSDDVWLGHTNNEYGVRVKQNGAVELRYDNVKKFETSSTGATLTGTLLTGALTVQGTFPAITLTDLDHNPDWILYNANGHFRIYDGTNNASRFSVDTSGHCNVDLNLRIPNDTGKLQLGTSQDLQIYHDGTDSHVNNYTGTFYIQAANNLVLQNTSGDKYFIGREDAATELYYDNSKKLETTSGGIEVSGGANFTSGNVSLNDNSKIKLGTGDDLQIFHDGNQSIIRDAGTGSLMLQGSQVIMESADGGEVLAKFIDDGAVELYHNNSKVLETMTQGVRITDNFLEINDTSCHLDFMENGSSNNHRLRQNAGNLYIQKLSDDKNTSTTQIVVDGGSGAVELYHSGTKKFETTSGGVDISGSTDGVLNLDTTDGRGSFIRFKENGTAKGYVGCSEGLGLGDQDDISLRATDRVFIQTGGSSETMRLGRSGSHAQVFVNCTETFSNAVFSMQTNGTTGIGLKAGATNQQFMINFRNPNGEVGTINTSGSSTSYNTSSDYRLKENAVAISDGITRLKTLKPYRFNFKTDASTTVDGFFAHEVTAVPEAITGTKDEVDENNEPVYQGIDQSKLVPLLVAALQEAIGRIEALEAK